MDLNKIKITPVIEECELVKITDKEYFGPNYSSYISNSRLGLLNPVQGGSPEAFFAGLKDKVITSDSLIMGSCVHGLTLQPEAYELCETINRPTAKLGYVCDFCYEHSKDGCISDDDISEMAKKCDYYQGDLNKFIKYLPTIRDYVRKRYEFDLLNTTPDIEPLFLNERQRPTLAACLNSICQNYAIQSLLHSGCEDSYNEYAILLKVELEFEDGYKTSFKLKSKLDHFSIDKNSMSVVINDIKTTSRFCSEFKTGFDNFHYRREFGMYSTLLSCYMKKLGYEGFDLTGNCLVVETSTDEHKSCVYNVSSDEIIRGAKEMAYLLKLAAYHERYRGFSL